MKHLPDVLIVLGWLAVVGGLVLVSLPLALVVGGVMLLAGGALLARSLSSTHPAPKNPEG